MSLDPFEENKLDITPDQLWNVQSIIQQAVMAVIMIASYFLVRYMIGTSPGQFSGLENWLERLHALFATKSLPSDMFTGVLTGFALAVVLFFLDAGVGIILRRNIKLWIHRSDYMLPVDKVQRKWALTTALVGSPVEELMFRGFIFLGILPIWNTWIWSAMLLSAVFSLLHAVVQGFWSTLWIFIVSLLLCYFVTIDKSFYFIALVHAMLNVTNLFILPHILKRKK